MFCVSVCQFVCLSVCLFVGLSAVIVFSSFSLSRSRSLFLLPHATITTTLCVRFASSSSFLISFNLQCQQRLTFDCKTTTTTTKTTDCSFQDLISCFASLAPAPSLCLYLSLSVSISFALHSVPHSLTTVSSLCS